MIPTIIGSIIGLVVCIILGYITRFLSNTVDSVDKSSKK